jgi:hypothetical protein
MNATEALTRLKEGNHRFVDGFPGTSAQGNAERVALTKGQRRKI